MCGIERGVLEGTRASHLGEGVRACEKGVDVCFNVLSIYLSSHHWEIETWKKGDGCGIRFLYIIFLETKHAILGFLLGFSWYFLPDPISFFFPQRKGVDRCLNLLPTPGEVLFPTNRGWYSSVLVDCTGCNLLMFTSWT